MRNVLGRSCRVLQLVTSLLGAVLMLGGAAVWAQSPFSGQAGFIFYVEGDVVLRGPLGDQPSRAQQLAVGLTGWRHLEMGQRIRTKAGRAEVVLAPGLLLGVGENTEIEMVKPHLSDLRLSLISGSTALHVVDDTYLEGLAVHFGKAEARFGKRGVYRLDAPGGESLRLKVFDGKAVVSTGESKHKVKKKWSLAMADPDSQPIVEKFDHSQKDALDQWQTEQVAALAAAEGAKREAAPRDKGREDLPLLVGVDR